MTTQPENPEPTMEAIALRLGRLKSMPVDTTGLERTLRNQLPPPPRRSHRRLWASLSAVAAALIVSAAIVFPLTQSSEVQASPVVMAQMYHDMVDGKVPTMRADSLADANRAIAAFSENGPTLPEAPMNHTMACCMRNVGKKKVACVLFENAGTPVTMAVANASDMQSPNSPTVMQDGITYHVQTTGDLHMVMTERNNRWICLIGKMPQAQLIEIARATGF
jgi:hypothetical protein